MRVIPVGGVDEGYPTSRKVDGVDTEAVADNLGYANQFGSPRRCHRDWTNSVTGKRMERPEHADADFRPEGEGY
jgi:hypothetical protein